MDTKGFLAGESTVQSTEPLEVISKPILLIASEPLVYKG